MLRPCECRRKIKTSDGKEVSLDQFKGQKAVVLFFFPKAATPGCTKEACKFRDEYSVFKEAGAEVLGISGDTPEANAAFVKAQRLPFPLLSDEDNAFRKTLGVKGNLLGLIPGRQVCFGVCMHACRYPPGPCVRFPCTCMDAAAASQGTAADRVVH